MPRPMQEANFYASGSLSTVMSTRFRLMKFFRAGIQRVAEFQLAALLAQRMLNDIGGHAKTDRAVAGLIMAEMAGALR